jgi:predicted amidophosphoribosyltransferase
MYCSSCGAAVARGISYCNLCGAKLNAAKDESAAKPAEMFSESLVWAIVAVFICGLGVTIGLMAMMKELLDFNQGLIIAFALLSFVLMFAVEGVLIWLLLQRRGEAQKSVDAERAKEQTTRELDAAKVRALPEPVPSVTENTTRTFEPIYNKRTSE